MADNNFLYLASVVVIEKSGVGLIVVPWNIISSLSQDAVRGLLFGVLQDLVADFFSLKLSGICLASWI